jgi:hypothetical protein
MLGEEQKNQLLQALGLAAETTEGKYLGLPTYIGRSRKNALYIFWRRF